MKWRKLPVLFRAGFRMLNSDLWIDSTCNSEYCLSVYENKYVFSFTTCSDADLSTMIDAYYNNKINYKPIAKKNPVGTTRSIQLSAMSATGVGESHAAQTRSFAIIGFEHDDLTTPINGHTKALLTLWDIDGLDEKGYMNANITNTGGWVNTPRYTWCKNVAINAFPSSIKSLMKPVNKLYNNESSVSKIVSSVMNEGEIVTFLSGYEICGDTCYNGSNSTVCALNGTQYQYFSENINRAILNNRNSWCRGISNGYNAQFETKTVTLTNSWITIPIHFSFVNSEQYIQLSFSI